MNAAGAIRRFIVESFLFGDNSELVSDQASLRSEGLIDSTDVMELVVFLESEFGIKVEDEEIVPANFDSVARLATYVETKLERSDVIQVAS